MFGSRPGPIAVHFRGAIESGSLNRPGDWAVTWDVNPPSGANREALFVNGVTWHVPYAMNPVKYNVWPRLMGSLEPFLKIGETITPVFDDATPGRFEYGVTPVR